VLEAARRDVVVYTAQVEFEREPVVMARLCDAGFGDLPCWAGCGIH
jgi:hypothetical protein